MLMFNKTKPLKTKLSTPTNGYNFQHESVYFTEDLRRFCEQMNLKSVRFMIKSGKSVFDNCKVLNSNEEGYNEKACTV